MSNKKYPVNSVLYTKDGRLVGNAIVIGHNNDKNIIKSDYGNIISLKDDEVERYFYSNVKSGWDIKEHKHYVDLREDIKSTITLDLGSVNPWKLT